MLLYLETHSKVSLLSRHKSSPESKLRKMFNLDHKLLFETYSNADAHIAPVTNNVVNIIYKFNF